MVTSNFEVLQLDTIDSTNEYAKSLILREDLQNNYIVVASHQTLGKGRLGRTWESPANMGLWASLILKPGVLPETMIWLNFMSSLTVCEVLRDLTRLPFELKWPNDVLIRGKKVCGILLETLNKNKELFLIIGIGINVNQHEFQGPLGKTATSLFIETQSQWDLSLLLQKIITRFTENNMNLDAGIFKRWKTMSGMFGRQITVVQSNNMFEAIAVDLATDGALLIKAKGGMEKIYAGDVQIKMT